MELSTRIAALRDAGPADLDSVADLLAEVYGAFRAHFPADPADAWQRYLGEIVDVRSRLTDSELIVAEQDGRLVGTVGFYPDAARSSLERWPAGWASIRALGVRPDARGTGVGQALGGECVRRARDRGLSAIGLHTASFMTAATRLYERLGFRRALAYDLEIGEMFTGWPLPAHASWQAQAFRLVLREE